MQKDHASASTGSNANAQIPLILSMHADAGSSIDKWPRKWNLSIIEYPVPAALVGGQCCSSGWHRISHDCVGTVSMFYPMGKGVQQASSTQLNTRDQITPGPLAFTQALTTLTGFLYSPCSLPMQDDDAGPSGMQAGQCSACCPCPMPLASDLQTFSTAACTHSTGSSRNGFCLHAPAVLLHLSELLQWLHGHVSLNSD
jgi:hypothetical protein